MRPVIIGSAAAIIIIGAFVAGSLYEETQDGPIENFGEKIEERITE